MKEINRAEHSGFCFGVKRAIEMAENVINAYAGKRPIYSMGQLIHNRDVTDELMKRGLCITDNLDVEENAIVIVRSHGEPENFFIEAGKRGIEIVDATCPYVKRIHNLVHTASSQGRRVVIAGDPSHPEVKGILGWSGDDGIAILDPSEAESIPDNKLFLVAQTTITSETFEGISEALMNRDVQQCNTICNATSLRQKACEELAVKSDIMLIVGGSNSSNTRKLFDISKKFCKNTYFIEKTIDLPLKELEKYNKIGIAAGASTPERIIEEVISKCVTSLTRKI